jgi:hypothetical protein
MRCPFCRAGHPNRADPACLPQHLKAELAERVTTVLEEERQTDALAEANSARVMFNMVVPYSTLVDNGRLFVRLDLLDNWLQTTFSLNVPLQRSGELLRSQGDFRSLGQMSGTQIRVSVTLCWASFGAVMVDESQTFRIQPIRRTPRPAETFRVSLLSASQFTGQARVAFTLNLTQPLDTENVLLNSVSWDPGADALELLAGEPELARVLSEI